MKFLTSKMFDREGIDLGSGKRMIVRGGKLDTKYNITVAETVDAAGGPLSPTGRAARRASAPVFPGAGAKAQEMSVGSARLKPCPDTRPTPSQH